MGKCHDTPFKDEAAETQEPLPNSYAIKWSQPSDLGLSDFEAHGVIYNAPCQTESPHMPKDNATSSPQTILILFVKGCNFLA